MVIPHLLLERRTHLRFQFAGPLLRILDVGFQPRGAFFKSLHRGFERTDDNVRQSKVETWRHIQHEGLGLNVFEAVPKYLREYRVKGVGITPLTPEFSRPLMLKTFCEAFEDDTPPPGSLSLPRILGAYVNRKSKNIASRIGCSQSAVTDALRDISSAMLSATSLRTGL
jgi:hypothetical protein